MRTDTHGQKTNRGRSRARVEKRTDDGERGARGVSRDDATARDDDAVDVQGEE